MIGTALENCFEVVLIIVAIIITFVAVNCGGLSSPLNGSISGNLTVYPNIVTFSCDPGFIQRGPSVRKCQSNGTWDGYETNCEGIMSKKFSGQILSNVIRQRLQECFRLSQGFIHSCLRWRGRHLLSLILRLLLFPLAF